MVCSNRALNLATQPGDFFSTGHLPATGRAHYSLQPGAVDWTARAWIFSGFATWQQHFWIFLDVYRPRSHGCNRATGQLCATWQSPWDNLEMFCSKGSATGYNLAFDRNQATGQHFATGLISCNRACRCNLATWQLFPTWQFCFNRAGVLNRATGPELST